MPAATIVDITGPARIPEAAPAAADRGVCSVTTGPQGFEGDGFPVRRVVAGIDLGDLDPVVGEDRTGGVDYGPGEPKGGRGHSRRGLKTVTYVIEGEIERGDVSGRMS